MKKLLLYALILSISALVSAVICVELGSAALVLLPPFLTLLFLTKHYINHIGDSGLKRYLFPAVIWLISIPFLLVEVICYHTFSDGSFTIIDFAARLPSSISLTITGVIISIPILIIVTIVAALLNRRIKPPVT